ncbi:MAG TPA: cytochrome P450 [Nocardioidaceae bacterium]|nr:cytochrome P450 [Nocardioidaceae bacterium]
MTATDDHRRVRPFRPGGYDRGAEPALPPGPRWPALVQSLALLRFRHLFVPAMHRRFGEVFTIRLPPQGQPLVLFTRPAHIKEIFAGDPEVFQAGKGNAILAPVMGEHSVLLQDGAGHQRARRLLMPAFNGATLHGYDALVTRLAQEEVARWRPGAAFRALDRMNAVTLEVVLRVVFGVTDESRLAALRPLVNRIIDVSPVLLLGWGHPLVRRLGPWRRAAADQAALDTLLYAEISERRTAPDLASRQDVLSRLLNVGGDQPLTDAELRDQLVTLLLAGHETTATALAWALHELGRDPVQLSRAQAAADTDDRDRLEAVMKESMRLHPVIPMVVRHLVRPATVGGIALPQGANVAPSILLTHARGDLHPDPEAFRPERFLESEVASATWIPFGGGVRRCLGAGFSLMEGVAVLREVLLHHDVSVPPGPVERPKVRNITSVPRHGARVVVRPRAGAVSG